MFDDITYYPYDPKTGKSTKPKSPKIYFTEQQLNTILTVACVVIVASLLMGLFALRQLSIEQSEADKSKAPQEKNSVIKR
jgi:NhaP-type Na+/H+ or K+/H+ antiporter